MNIQELFLRGKTALRQGVLKFFNAFSVQDQEDIKFMGQVDAALHRKPRIGPLLLSTGTLCSLH